MHQFDLTVVGKKEAELLRTMRSAKTTGNWLELVRLVRIKGTKAPKMIMDELGLNQNGYYEQARRAITINTKVRTAIKNLVPDPFATRI